MRFTGGKERTAGKTRLGRAIAGAFACAALFAGAAFAVTSLSAGFSAGGAGVAGAPSQDVAVDAPAAEPATSTTASASAASLSPVGISAIAGMAFADDATDAVDDTFEVDGLTYRVTAVSEGSSAGDVTLTRVAKQTAGALAVPASVASPTTGRVYHVSALEFAAFMNCSAITSLSLPETIEGYRFLNSYVTGKIDACFYGCDALSSIEVDADCPAFMSVDGVLYAKGPSGLPAALLCYPHAKSDIASFQVPATVHTVVPYAVYGNASLTSVSFTGDLTGDAVAYGTAAAQHSSFAGGIGSDAFASCTSLVSVDFAPGLKIGVATSTVAPAIASEAFADCVSLTSITIPNIVSATRKGDAYHTFEEYNPDTNQTTGTSDLFYSGFDSYWHNAKGPVSRSGIGDGAFSGCSNLRSVVLTAGNPNGAFAYWEGTTTIFEGCDALESLVFASTQSYWGNPSASMRNGAYVDMWTNSSTGEKVLANVPSRYYAVDYYATADDADAADAEGSTRLARVEYAAGTATSAIAAGDASLADATVDRSLYALTEADGVVPDAQQAAREAGLGEGDWAWKLTGTQSRRAGLTDSCKAHLVKRTDLSAGRIDGEAQTALYLACDRNLSRSDQGDYAFDIARYASGTSYRIEALSGERDPWYDYDASTGSFLEPFTVRAADGTELSAEDCTISYKIYDAETGELQSVSSVTRTGAYLVSITPAEGSGYTGQLDEWILVKTRVGKVVSGFSDTVSGTANAARHVYSQTASLDFSGRPYSVTVGACDGAGALVAAGYAGLVGGAVNADDSDSASYGFTINPSSGTDGRANPTVSSTVFSRTSTDGAIEPAVYAVKCYQAFESRRMSLGASASAYPWGTTAVLVPSLYEQYYAAAASWAYAMRAPVFFTNNDGSVSAETAACLGKFANVVVMGSEAAFLPSDYDALATTLGSDVALTRLEGASDTAGAFSVAVADDLIARDVASASSVAIVDSIQPADAAASLIFAGHEKGLLLCALSTADAKLIAEYLHAKSGEVSTVLLAGRTGDACATNLASSEWTGSAFGAIWETDSVFSKVMGSLTSSVDEYAGIDVTRPSRGGDKGDDDDDHGDNGDNKGGSNGEDKSGGNTTGDDSGTGNGGANDGAGTTTQTTYRTYVETYSNSTDYAVGTRGAASATGVPAATASAATAGKAVAEPVGESALADAADENPITRAIMRESAPLTASVPFLATIGVLCAAAAPVLRRCK